MSEPDSLSRATEIIADLTARGMTMAVAESLTGGLLVAELIRPAGASAVVNGGVVAYNTDLKKTVLGVDPLLLAEFGAVHPGVAQQLARNVREVLAVGGHPADIGIATTGVAGPDSVDGHPVGTVFLGLSMGETTLFRKLALSGSRQQIRDSTVTHALAWIAEALERGLANEGE